MNEVIHIERTDETDELPASLSRKEPRVFEHSDIRDTSLFDDIQVHTGPLYDGKSEKMPNAFALYYNDGVRAWDGAVSGTYSLTNHAPLYRQHADLIINESELPWQNVEVRDEITNGGLKARRSIKYLENPVDVGQGDLVFCRSDVINSVNMTWAFQMFAGAYRDLCENSMVFGGYKSGYAKKKHTKHFSDMKGTLLATANTTLATFANQTERFKQWKKTQLTDEQAYAFIRSQCDVRTKKEKKYDEASEKEAEEEEKRDAFYNPSVKTIEQNYEPVGNMGASELIENDDKVNKALYYSLCGLWDDYTTPYNKGGGLGRNAWALYNVFTHWATHTHNSVEYEDEKGKIKDHKLGRKNESRLTTEEGNKYTLSAQKERSEIVAVMLTTPQWQSLAA